MGDTILNIKYLASKTEKRICTYLVVDKDVVIVGANERVRSAMKQLGRFIQKHITGLHDDLCIPPKINA